MGGRGGFPAHVALFVACAALLVAGAMYDNLWFDEAYSVALAAHSAPELLRIAATDVHPPLYYLMLRVVWLLAGGRVWALRLLSVSGAIAVAALGLTHVAPRHGRAAGMRFTALVALLPAPAYLACQVRMYSWAALAAAACLLCALGVRERVERGLDAEPATWAGLALGGLAAAYLHYYAAMAAFAVNACLLASLLRLRGGVARRAALTQLLLALAQVAAYAPWLVVVSGQAATVSGGFWVRLGLVDVLRLAAAPLVSEPLEAAVGWSRQMVLLLALAALSLSLLAAAARGARLAAPAPRRAASWGLACYLAPALVGAVAGAVLGTAVLHWRYLCVGAGPLALAAAVGSGGLSPARRRALGVALGLVAALSQAAFLGAAYDPASRAPAEFVREAGAPVASADVTLLGSLAASCPGTELVYADWSGGGWEAAYEAFAPAMRCASDPAETLSPGAPALLWLSGDGAEAVRAADELGLRVAWEREIWRPYDRRTYSLALLVSPVA